MKTKVLLFAFLFGVFLSVDVLAQTMPLVYSVEDTGAGCPVPYMPSLNELPVSQALPNLFEWSDGRGQIKYYSDWEYRRNEIGDQIQYYEIGEKPTRPDTISASFSNSDSTLTVNITKNGKTLTPTSHIYLPSGSGPFPAIIGMDFAAGQGAGELPNSFFLDRKIAVIEYVHNQVTTYGSPSNTDPYYKLYPNLNVDNTGQYSAWAWGVSRALDYLKTDKSVKGNEVGIEGLSRFGKAALVTMVYDQRFAIGFIGSSGKGGATLFRRHFGEEVGNSLLRMNIIGSAETS